MLSSKVKSVFGDLAVDKKVASKSDFTMLPRYVVENLASRFAEKYGNDYISKLQKFISKYYHEAKEREKILSDLMKFDKIIIMDELRVETDIYRKTYRAHLENLTLRNCMIDQTIVDEFENLLITGMWGLVTLRYAMDIVPKDNHGNPLMTPVLVSDFQPFQCSYTDINLFKEARDEFTFDEWLDVLTNTLGLNPKVYDRRQKIILITRLLPLVERNYNLIEFGPRATGKTYLYRNSTHYVRIFAGGKISPAVLFYNIARKVLGEIGVKDAVVMDEISKVKFSNPHEMVGKLKDYMESGQYERGPKKAASGCSLVFMGNISVERDESGRFVPVEELTHILPEDMRDSALIDRIHGIIPGWELPKISKSGYHLSKEYGIASDYFSEVMHKMRNLSYTHIVDEEVVLVGDYTIREERSIKKTVSALIKLLLPNESFDKEELRAIVDIAAEYRKRVNDWLHILEPGEFPKKQFEYSIS